MRSADSITQLSQEVSRVFLCYALSYNHRETANFSQRSLQRFYAL